MIISLESNEEEKGLYLATSGWFQDLLTWMVARKPRKDSTAGLNCPREAFIFYFILKISSWSSFLASTWQYPLLHQLLVNSGVHNTWIKNFQALIEPPITISRHSIAFSTTALSLRYITFPKGSLYIISWFYFAWGNATESPTCVRKSHLTLIPTWPRIAISCVRRPKLSILVHPMIMKNVSLILLFTISIYHMHIK
jgi:hypothetical protein